ncbi:hypothetical protein SH139x_004195 [Planctomycetaceae bacterium SH139]
MSRFSIYLYGPLGGPLPVDFETLAERLSALPKMYFEMDGSWVWTGQQQGHRWQLDGMLYDANGKVQYIDLKGSCPLQQWKLLLMSCNYRRPENRPGDGFLSTSDSGSWTVYRLLTRESLLLEQFEQEIWGNAE